MWQLTWAIASPCYTVNPFSQVVGCIAAGKLLAKEPELKANFSRAQGAGSNAKANKVARFLPNPEANWGPKPKHGRAVKVCTSLHPLHPYCNRLHLQHTAASVFSSVVVLLPPSHLQFSSSSSSSCSSSSEFLVFQLCPKA